MYNNPYMNYQQNFNQQSINERIDNQIAQLQQMKEQMKNNVQPAINQTFQLAPTHPSMMKYASSLNDVEREMVYADTPYFSKDMSVVWVKNIKGEIKTYELNEIIPKSEKDLQIEYLMSEIKQLKGKIENDGNTTNVDAEQDTTDTTADDDTIRTTTKKDKSSSISKVSTSKKE